MDDRPRAHVCRGRSHHRRRCRHPAQCHRPDTRGRLIHLCRAACRHSLQDCLPHRHVGDGRVPIRRSPAVDAVWSAFAERCALRFLYQNGRGEQRERTVCVYGMFEREGTAYFCGLDNATGNIRTFRCDRIIRAWRPSKAYAIPADFNLNDYLFFEFDFADRPPVAATFSFAREAQADMINGLTRGRGELMRTEAGWTWTVDVRDLKPQPRFALPMPWMA
ncbi:MAG: helix-turn-helix transcriptional regulator [Collinsella sp.]